MTEFGLADYAAVWLVDFEFSAPPGERPTPLCLVARDLVSGRLVRRWLDDRPPDPPIDLGPASLYVAYYALAELGCHLALGWPLPARVLDLFVEFRNLTNGRPVPAGNGLLGALAYFGLPTIDAAEKSEMRDLALRGGSYKAEEREALLNYCQTDVDALAALLPKMLPAIDLSRALLRGRYMGAAARMEHAGIPIDVRMFTAIRESFEPIKIRLIERIDADFGVYVETKSRSTCSPRRSFSSQRFAAWLTANDIPWPRLESGALTLDDDTFRQMARAYPTVAPLRELRRTLGQMRLNDLAVGSDGRNRCLLSAFRSRTGRNQPSNKRYIFGPSVWLRSLIKPERGRAVAYVDWSQQEFGIAAALSGDTNMQAAYRSTDPYLTFAKQAGAVPSGATKATHPRERQQFKICALAVQYGMGEKSLSESLGEPEIFGRELLRLHRQTYPTFWRWSQAAVDHAMLHGWLQTVFGWRIYVGSDVNPRSLANFPCQANGAEMLRLACCLATERGIAVCAPVHDAVLIEGASEGIETVVVRTQEAMREASEVVLSGFSLRTDVEIVRWPDRYSDDRGRRMWETVCELVDECRRGVSSGPVTARDTDVLHRETPVQSDI